MYRWYHVSSWWHQLPRARVAPSPMKPSDPRCRSRASWSPPRQYFPCDMLHESTYNATRTGVWGLRQEELTIATAAATCIVYHTSRISYLAPQQQLEAVVVATVDVRIATPQQLTSFNFEDYRDRRYIARAPLLGRSKTLSFFFVLPMPCLHFARFLCIVSRAGVVASFRLQR